MALSNLGDVKIKFWECDKEGEWCSVAGLSAEKTQYIEAIFVKLYRGEN